MTLTLIGVNHRTAPVELRERLSIAKGSEAEVLRPLASNGGIRGSAVISTCNRVEIVVSSEAENVIEPVVELLAERAEREAEQIEKHLYVLRHRDAIRHMFRVASGLDSMIIGEPQIGGQVRDSYQIAKNLDTLDSTLYALYEQTLHVAKRVRTETGIGEHAVSIPFAAVELAKKIFGELSGLRAFLVGAGEMGELTAEHLKGNGLEAITVANRAFEKAVELAGRFGGEAASFDNVGAQLAGADIVIVSTSAPNYTVTAEQVRAAMNARRRGDIFLIDLSVPRNIDPAVGDVEGAYLYNIDDLSEVAESNKAKRLEKAAQADRIIEKEVDGFLKRLATQDAVPTIVELQRRLDEIRQAELEKCLRKMGPVTAEQRQAIEALTTGIINKVAHYPIIRLRESASAPHEGETIRETIRKIFGLR
ncbi:MAG: glutamyl-tRNA reductase [Acidobacteria bacterium]|nr:glutamyl-tRNA reductase [Acidobacteriota bacterium]